MIEPKQILKYSDKILEIMDKQETLTRNELQCFVATIIMNIISEAEAKQRMELKNK